jgi:hypothetical protein
MLFHKPYTHNWDRIEGSQDAFWSSFYAGIKMVLTPVNIGMHSMVQWRAWRISALTGERLCFGIILRKSSLEDSRSNLRDYGVAV